MVFDIYLDTVGVCMRRQQDARTRVCKLYCVLHQNSDRLHQQIPIDFYRKFAIGNGDAEAAAFTSGLRQRRSFDFSEEVRYGHLQAFFRQFRATGSDSALARPRLPH